MTFKVGLQAFTSRLPTGPVGKIMLSIRARGESRILGLKDIVQLRGAPCGPLNSSSRREALRVDQTSSPRVQAALSRQGRPCRSALSNSPGWGRGAGAGFEVAGGFFEPEPGPLRGEDFRFIKSQLVERPSKRAPRRRASPSWSRSGRPARSPTGRPAAIGRKLFPDRDPTGSAAIRGRRQRYGARQRSQPSIGNLPWCGNSTVTASPPRSLTPR